MEGSRPVVLYDDATLVEHTYVATQLPQAEVIPIPGPLSHDRALPPEAATARVLSTSRRSAVDATLLTRLPALQLVVARAASPLGVDVATCRARGVTVCGVPHTGENTVAEHTFALILALTRKLLVPYVLPPVPGIDPEERLRGIDLQGKTIGIVGLGHVGLRVARIARVFGMQVLTYDVQPDPVAAEAMGIRLVTSEDLGHWVRVLDELDRAWTIQFVPLDELLARSQIVTLHTTATRASRHLIDRNALARMQRGALLINTAHGSLVDPGALVEALDTGRLGGAGLDVLEDDELLPRGASTLGAEEAEQRHRVAAAFANFARRPNVVLSPHNAFNSAEGMARILAATVETIAAFLDGRPINVVASA